MNEEGFDYGFVTRKKPKKVHYSIRKQIRFAPLQKRMIEYIVENKPNEFFNESDFIRRAITLQARTVLTQEEFDMVCGIAFKEQRPEVK
jgi:hypothetical protein